jgi:energy-coupling factor transporter ATP-binding protein EcfA2
VKLLRERLEHWDEYPFNVPPITALDSLDLTSRVGFFVGENGTGKSTLLEAIAAHGGHIHEIAYRESRPFQLVSRFVAAPERYTSALFCESADSEQ